MFYDCEHGILSEQRLHDLMLYGNAIGIPSLVRVKQLDKANVSYILDCGATGVMVPMVETKQQALSLVNLSKYPPLGQRSYSGGANTNYAPSGNHKVNMESLNKKTITIAQIESLKGVENVDEIASVEGIDALIVGPCDLGISINNPDNVMDERELKLIQMVIDACKKYNKKFGIIGNNELLTYFRNDLDYLVSAIDMNILKAGIRQAAINYEKIYKEI